MSLNLREKNERQWNFLTQTWWRPFYSFFVGYTNDKFFVFCVTSKAVFMFFCFYWRKKSNSDVFSQSVSFITQWKQWCQNIFAQILRDLARIFDRPKFSCVRFLQHRLLHHCVWSPVLSINKRLRLSEKKLKHFLSLLTHQNIIFCNRLAILSAIKTAIENFPQERSTVKEN